MVEYGLAERGWRRDMCKRGARSCISTGRAEREGDSQDALTRKRTAEQVLPLLKMGQCRLLGGGGVHRLERNRA